MQRPVLVASTLAAVALVAAACQPETGRETATVRLVPGERSTPAFTEGTLEIAAPAPGSFTRDTALAASLRVDGFELGAATPGAESRGIAVSDGGQHVHFIVDNEPYVALYDVDDPVEVSGLEPGLHVLRAFLSRSWHESVKNEGAFDVTYFFVRDTAVETTFEPEAPLLTYSRPKGLYRGPDADSVMVDFYLSDAELGPDAHSVRLTVDDTLSFEIQSWAPHYLLGLSSGEHAVKLDLLAPDGTPVPGPFNSTERVITVVREPGDEGGAAAGSGAPGGSAADEDGSGDGAGPAEGVAG